MRKQPAVDIHKEEKTKQVTLFRCWIMAFSASFPEAYCLFYYNFPVWNFEIDISSIGNLKIIPQILDQKWNKKTTTQIYVFSITGYHWMRKTGLPTWTKGKYYSLKQCFPNSTLLKWTSLVYSWGKPNWLYKLKYFRWSIVSFSEYAKGRKWQQ